MKTAGVVQLIPILDSNYVFLIKNEKRECIVVDPGEGKAVIREIEKQHLKLKGILITHHHADHIDGIAEIKKKFLAPVWAPEANRAQIPADYYIHDGFEVNLAGFEIKAMALPGHTLGIHAYWFENEHWLFSGDVLFGLGCGRIFEGTYEQAYQSLQKIKSLPDETKVFCTHEYTNANMQFCESLGLRIEEYNLAVPTVPLSLIEEKRSNPFLKAASLEEFSRLRDLRNVFKPHK
jgi:hydroxyacylglutathione hydrolase